VTTRLIGVGNTLRGDDAAGLEVARRVAGRAGGGLDVVTCGGGPAALLDAWAGAETVVLVDAARSGAPAGAVRRLTAAAAGAARLGAGTHDTGLAAALALGEALGRRPPALEIWAIEGGDFTLGAPLSPPVEAAVEALAGRLLAEHLPAGLAPTPDATDRLPARPS
jgi:hydrogenase maturation protease